MIQLSWWNWHKEIVLFSVLSPVSNIIFTFQYAWFWNPSHGFQQNSQVFNFSVFYVCKFFQEKTQRCKNIHLSYIDRWRKRINCWWWINVCTKGEKKHCRVHYCGIWILPSNCWSTKQLTKFMKVLIQKQLDDNTRKSRVWFAYI